MGPLCGQRLGQNASLTLNNNNIIEAWHRKIVNTFLLQFFMHDKLKPVAKSLIAIYRDIAVTVGEYDLSGSPDCIRAGTICAPPEQTIYAKDAIVHSEFNQKKTDFQSFDIALLRLLDDIQFNGQWLY